MREITFRGKDAKTGEWVYGDLSFHHYGLHHNGIPFISGWSRDADNSPKNYWSREVVPETVGQYIGLDTQSGEKIFEGDIVESQLFGRRFQGSIELSEDSCAWHVRVNDNASTGLQYIMIDKGIEMTKQEAAGILMKKRQTDAEIIDEIVRDQRAEELADYMSYIREEMQVYGIAISALLGDEA